MSATYDYLIKIKQAAQSTAQAAQSTAQSTAQAAQSTQARSHLHFRVENVEMLQKLEKFCGGKMEKQDTFTEIVYDDRNFSFLKAGVWILLRNGLFRVRDKFRRETGHWLYWNEEQGDKAVARIVKQHNKPEDFIENYSTGAMHYSVTRYSITKNLWVDFTEWSNKDGKPQRCVTCTADIDWASDNQWLFDCTKAISMFPTASKAVVCAYANSVPILEEQEPLCQFELQRDIQVFNEYFDRITQDKLD